MKFLIDHIFLIGIVLLSGGSLLWPAIALRGKRATVLEVTQLINRGKTMIIDVREPAEFGTGHLPDAKNIPLAQLADKIGELDKMKAKSIVVVCESGARSASAARILTKAGFEDVVNLDGGLVAWRHQGLPLAK
ncbi:MAG: rhodanese-like domain-containing protein [Burkholderiaceae bacterium]|nr:rhodanese-like domain-containing protein [Burkholderiaceae bacterium]